MRAKSAYELRVTRGRGLDQVEVIEIASGEVVLFWELRTSATGGVVRRLRAGVADAHAEAAE